MIDGNGELLKSAKIATRKGLRILTGCPAQAKAIPPQVAETITTTRSDMNLSNNRPQMLDCLLNTI